MHRLNTVARAIIASVASMCPREGNRPVTAPKMPIAVLAIAAGIGASTALVVGAGTSTATGGRVISTATATALPPPHPVPMYLSVVTINRHPVFHGQVHAGRRCLRHRTVQVRRRSTGRMIGKTTTGGRGGWELRRWGIHGRFYARVTEKGLKPRGVCLSAKSRHFVHLR